jgi:hypothetical protein
LLFTINQNPNQEEEEEELENDEADEDILHQEGVNRETFAKWQIMKKESLQAFKASSMNDFIIKANQVIWISSRLGLTGRAFQDGAIAFNNLGVQRAIEESNDPMQASFYKRLNLRVAQHEFMGNIDNIVSAKDFNNYMIGAIYNN